MREENKIFQVGPFFSELVVNEHTHDFNLGSKRFVVSCSQVFSFHRLKIR